MMIGMVGGWVFLLVPAHPGSPGQRAIKRLLYRCCLLTCRWWSWWSTYVSSVVSRGTTLTSRPSAHSGVRASSASNVKTCTRRMTSFYSSVSSCIDSCSRQVLRNYDCRSVGHYLCIVCHRIVVDDKHDRVYVNNSALFMVALCNRADHIYFHAVVCSSFFFFFLRLISAAADWMSAILPHMVWP